MEGKLCRTLRNFLNEYTEREVIINAFGFAGPLQRALKYYTSGHGVPPSRV